MSRKKRKKSPREIHEEDTIRSMKSSCGTGGMYPDGLKPPTKRFTKHISKPYRPT